MDDRDEGPEWGLFRGGPHERSSRCREGIIVARATIFYQFIFNPGMLFSPEVIIMPDGARGPPGRGQGQRGVPPETCVCPACGYEKTKVRGVPCRDTECPKCGVPMMGK